LSAVVPGAVPYKASLAKSLIGPAGEYHCLAQLLARGYLATPAPPATPEADILVLSLDGAIAATIQVKTRTRGGDRGWMMNAKHEKIIRPHLFYAFVDFEQSASPLVFVIHSSVVADVLRRDHEAWLAALGANGQQHKDNPIRRVKPSYQPPVRGFPDGWMENYRDRWEQIRQPGKAAGQGVLTGLS
jgi:hypothetical protein